MVAFNVSFNVKMNVQIVILENVWSVKLLDGILIFIINSVKLM